MIFVTKCPQCHGTKIGNIDVKATLQSKHHSYGPTIYRTKEGKEREECGMCLGSGQVIVELKSPFVPYDPTMELQPGYYE